MGKAEGIIGAHALHHRRVLSAIAVLSCGLGCYLQPIDTERLTTLCDG